MCNLGEEFLKIPPLVTGGFLVPPLFHNLNFKKMALLKGITKKTETAKPIVLANDNLSAWRDWDGKSLAEIDETHEILSIDIANSTNDIPALLLELKDKTIAFSFSKGIGADYETAKDFIKQPESVYGRFYIRRKRMLDAEGNAKPGEDTEPTGPEFIFFGKPSGIVYKTRETVYNADTVAAE